MIFIPEELLKLSDKEAILTLDNKNKYTADYFVREDNRNTVVDKVIKRFKNIIIFQDYSNKLFSEELNNYMCRSAISILSSETFKQLKKSRVGEYLNTCSKEEFNNYLRKLGSEVFGEEFIDVQNSSLIIYFPELTITNSVEMSHTMYDIYFRFKFYQSGTRRVLDSVSFARTTATDVELAARYLFSHCGDYSLGRYGGTLCYGNTSFAHAIDKLYRGDIFTLFPSVLMTLKEYLSWESLEGTPYVRMESIKEMSNLSSSSYSNYRDINFQVAYKELFKDIADFNYSYELINGKYTIKLTQESIDQIDNYLSTKYPDSCYITINDKSYVLNSYEISNYSHLNDKDSQVFFKGQIVKTKVIVSKKEDDSEYTKKIHRSILNDVIQRLENKFTNYLIEKKLNECI